MKPTVGHLGHVADPAGEGLLGSLEARLDDQLRRRGSAKIQEAAMQVASYEPLPGKHVNGQLTLGENIGDLAGLVVAYDAYRLSLDGQELPVGRT